MRGLAKNESSPAMLDVEAIRSQFPLLSEAAGRRGVCYLDNAATSHKPRAVLDAIDDCYRHHYGPVHRGLYTLAEQATARYEQARAAVARFIGAPSADRLIFTRSATEAINAVSTGWAEPRLRPGDQVWVSRLEHHSNFLPWQRVCQRTGAQLRIIELWPDGRLDFASAADLYGPRTRLIALAQVSNVLGTITPIREVVTQAQAHGIPVLVDAAQSVAHGSVNVAELGCDFLAFSAHKIGGPTGIGALYARTEHLDAMEPWLVGGGMVDEVGESQTSWAQYPAKFEAGSPNLAGAIGFAAAVDFLAGIGMERVRDHVQALTQQALRALAAMPDVQVHGPAEATGRAGIVAFNLRGVHPHDVAQLLAERGVSIRAGHHCCQPLMRFLGVPATARASFALYNSPDDVDVFIEAIHWARRVLV